MSERDLLSDRFAAFRDAAVATTRPPGVEAVRRRVARRDAIRTLAVGAVAAILAIAFVLVGATGGQPQPIVPTPAPSSPSPDSEPSPSTVDIPRSAAPTSGSAATGQNADGCPYGEPLILGGDYLHASPGDYWSRCPSSRVRIYTVVYEWDVGQQRYTRAHLAYIYLTAANPTAPVPSADLDPVASVCGYAFLVVGNDSDPPAVLPVEAANATDYQYWYQHGLGSPTVQEWRTAPNYHQLQICQPPASVTP